MAVVDGEYLTLKRYNLAELGTATDQEEDSVPTRVSKDTKSTLMQGENPQATDQARNNSNEIGNG